MAYISFQPNDYFNTVLYTGNGSTNAISGIGFQPDWVWIKQRGGTTAHNLVDAVRGVNKALSSNSTDAQGDYTPNNLNAFGTDGFTLGNGSLVNVSSGTYASWNWKANGQGSSNTDGSINTTYTSVNTTSGVSISTYSGTGSAATIGHGLGAIPQVMIVKNTYQAEHWIVYHHKSNATPEDYYLRLNDTTASSDFPMWNDTAPTSSVFSVGTSTSVNQAGGTFVAYCFAEKKGFSKFGSYTGNGEASDNAFIYTGFKPAFVLIKATDVDEWRIYDNKRANPFNVIDVRLKANSSDAESSGNNECDFLSNGIKIRSNSGGVGSSGQEYIYMAFAENPFTTSDGVPTTAR